MTADDVRARFEAWAVDVAGFPKTATTYLRNPTGYDQYDLQKAWIAWQAAHADLSGEVRELAQDVHDRFVWMQSPDTKGEHHKVRHESVMKALELADTLLAKFPHQRANNYVSGSVDVHGQFHPTQQEKP